MNERYLRWDASAQRQLVMIWVAQQLDVTMAELEGAAGQGCMCRRMGAREHGCGAVFSPVALVAGVMRDKHE